MTGVASTPDAQDGDIVMQANDITLERITLVRSTTSQDIPGGDIIINAGKLTLTGGAQLSTTAFTSSPNDIQGSAGDIILNVSDEITVQGGFRFSPFSSFTTGIFSTARGERINFFSRVRNGRVLGDAGDIIVNTQRFLVKEGAEIASGTTSAGNGGDIRINASELVSVDGILPDAVIFRSSGLTLQNSAIVTASEGAGTGGDLSIQTGKLMIANAGALDSQSSNTGSGGNIDIVADVIDVAGSIVPMFDIPPNTFLSSLPVASELPSQITAAASDGGDAGDISINANRLNLQTGGVITTETQEESTGNGGVLAIDVSEEIFIDGVSVLGEPSGLFSSTEGSGNAGEVQVDTQRLDIFNGGAISAATLSDTAESSGSLDLQVDRLFLNNGQLTVETEAQAGIGADIAISGLEVLLLRNDSLISAEAFNGADGGNIRIDAAEGFVVSPFEEDSDILARANLGNGGEIEIVAQSILGLVEGLAIPGNGTNDIDASSSFGSSGTVLLNELEVNPAVEDADLPDSTGAPEISQQCNPGQGVSSFVATGRGGVPPEPQATVPEILWQPDDFATESASPSAAISPQIVEAQGWQSNGTGQIVLTAASTKTIPHATPSSATHCSLVRSSV